MNSGEYGGRGGIHNGLPLGAEAFPQIPPQKAVRMEQLGACTINTVLAFDLGVGRDN